MSPCGIQPSRLARFALFFSLFWVPRVDADGVNRTIDDTFGDSVTKQRVTYTPASGVWHDATCLTSSGCAIVGDPTQCFSSTYTAATYRDPWSETSIAMQFNGTAIYVFFILANNMGTGIITQTVANFTLDGGQPQLFTHQPDPNTKDLNYGQLVFSLTNLTNSEHTLVISASEVHINSYINFDYAVYTHEDDTQSLTQNSAHKKSAPIGAIVGGVIGGIAVLLALAFLILYWVLRRRRTTEGKKVEPGFDPQMMVEVNPASLSQSPPRPSGSVDPFLRSLPSQGNISPHSFSPVRKGIHSPQASISQRAFSPQTPISTVHSGAADNNSSNGRPDTDLSSSSGRQYDSTSQLPLVSVTPGDHLSAPNGNVSAIGRGKAVDVIRHARQRELDECLRSLQFEMATLAADISNNRVTRRTSAQQYPSPHGNPTATGTEDAEMSAEEMKEQLQIMREQIEYLTAQQQSPWAQGLSDDPPPGYTVGRM